MTAEEERAGTPPGDGHGVEGAPVLEARGVEKRYGEVRALAGVDLAVRAGECVALVGESGSGKTTLLRIFNRMVEPGAGRVWIRGRPARALEPVRLRRETGYVPQEGGLMPHWTVLRNAAMVPWLLGMEDGEERARRALDRVGLPAERYGARWPRDLSGGQRQRVAIARAIAARPAVLLLDEPFGALDAITRAEIREHFAAMRRELGITSVLVTHDLHEAVELGDRVVVLREGAIERVAPPGELLERPGTPYVARLLRRAGLLQAGSASAAGGSRAPTDPDSDPSPRGPREEGGP